MTSALHVYDREIHEGEHTSLSVLSSHIPPAAQVLDLGCGSGAIGRFLARRGDDAVIDGLTLNTEEAALAAPHYRRVEVANLDHTDLAVLFAGNRYDTIICADVLEHTCHPERVLAGCRSLLTDSGRLLISIPNVSYSGLIAELMAGEFRYRPEGLLDETHLRFFTRNTLIRFLVENGWALDSLKTIQRPLPESEFRIAFDALPPPVAQHLLALPDALTYQFIVIARAAAPGETVKPPPLETLSPARALFNSELYLNQLGRGYAEAHKITATGVIGQPQQILRFILPPDEPPTELKFDPADRPGFFYLHSLTLRNASGETLWHWDGNDALLLLQTERSGMVLQPPATPQGALIALLLDNDPWIQLPIPVNALTQAAGGTLEVEAGWPMSADWLALASATQHEILRVRKQAYDIAETRSQELAETAETRSQELERKAEKLKLKIEALEQQNEFLGW